jgi:PhzF family phenazine biosynthesis protein
LNITAIKVGKQIMMKFPLYDTIEYSPNPDLYKELGIKKPINTRFAPDLDMLIIEVADKKTLINIKPDFSKLLQTSDTLKEVVVTAKSTERKYDFYSRCFCPWIGINEDPVTGASHSVLAKYWGNILGKSDMSAYQVSERGGYMDLKISNNFLEVTSDARIVFEGVINL